MPVIRWIVLDYGHYWSGDTLFLFATTDVQVRLTVHYTTKPPWLHDHTKEKRGFRFLADPKYCFVEWLQLIQVEPGDTLEHSFAIPGWTYCQTLWFHFLATYLGEPTTSNTGIMSAHAFDQGSAFDMKHTSLIDKQVADVIDHADLSITPAKLVLPFSFPAFPFTPSSAPVQDYHVANKKYVDDQPAGDILTWSDTPPLVIDINDVSGWSGWVNLDLSAHLPVGVKAIHTMLRLSILTVLGVTYHAWFGIRKGHTAPVHYPIIWVNEKNFSSGGGLQSESAICGVANDRSIDYAYTTSLGGAFCTIWVRLVIFGWII